MIKSRMLYKFLIHRPASIRPISKYRNMIFFYHKCNFSFLHFFSLFHFPFSSLCLLCENMTSSKSRENRFIIFLVINFTPFEMPELSSGFIIVVEEVFFCPTDWVSIMEMTAWVIGLVKNHRMLYLHLFYINYNSAII